MNMSDCTAYYRRKTAASSLLAVVAGSLSLFTAGTAWAHETKLNCTAAAAAQPAIESARTELGQKPKNAALRSSFADNLIGIGCYDEAVHVLEDGLKLDPSDKKLETRLKTARSFIGEREYLDKQPAKSASGAEFLRFQLRCKQFGEVQACDQALGLEPNDATLWAAKGDALLKERRSQDALTAFNRAKQVSVTSGQVADLDIASRINTAQAMLAAQRPPSIVQAGTGTAPPVRTAARPQSRIYSNIEPAGRSN
jgi:predicted Zn-dependent protease